MNEVSRMEFEAALRRLAGLEGARPDAGTWTPTWTGLTVVGTLSTTGRYRRQGGLVYVHVTVSASVSVASVAGVTFVNNLPFVSAASGFGLAGDLSVTFGTGLIAGGALIASGTPSLYTPTWVASGHLFGVDALYEV